MVWEFTGRSLVSLSAGLPNDGTYLWARASVDGQSAYASRLADGAVVIDQLSVAPRRVVTSIRLPFAVSPSAPAGYCPIDGYLATFSIGAAGMVLLTHRAGPIGHSCPALLPGMTTTSVDPWRCQSPEGSGFELRSGDYERQGQSLGMFIGAKVAIAADNPSNSTIAITQGLGGTTVFHVGGPPPECCFGGYTGVAFAVSPDGQHLALSPEGRSVHLTALQAAHIGPPLWSSPDNINALAWAGAWVVVAHGDHLTYLSTEGSPAITVALGGFGDATTIAPI